jgi:hypothetical protein
VRCRGLRLQELFGVTETPPMGRGGVSVQVTRDLAGFWRTTYFDTGGTRGTPSTTGPMIHSRRRPPAGQNVEANAGEQEVPEVCYVEVQVRPYAGICNDPSDLFIVGFESGTIIGGSGRPEAQSLDRTFKIVTP